MRDKRPEQGNRTGPESVGRLYIRETTVVSASKPLKQQGFVSRQADIAMPSSTRYLLGVSTRESIRFAKVLYASVHVFFRRLMALVAGER
jgi:hypothetical protein